MKSLLKSILRETNNPILHNKFILYAVFFIALVYLYGLSIQRSWFHIAIFILIGYVSTFFSKNMTVVLIIAVVLTNILRSGSKAASISEGLENGIPESNAGTAEKPEDELPDVGVQEQLENENDEEVEIYKRNGDIPI